MRICDHCRYDRPSVKYDAPSAQALCDPCWFGRRPREGTPEPVDDRDLERTGLLMRIRQKLRRRTHDQDGPAVEA